MYDDGTAHCRECLRRHAAPASLPMIPHCEMLMTEAVRVLGIRAVKTFLTQFDWPMPLKDQPRCIADLTKMVMARKLHMFDAPERSQ
jgi:hypothetical protein